MKTVTVTGIRGEQQRAIAAAFAARGWSVRPTARGGGDSPLGAARPADLVSGDGLRDAFAGADAVAVTLPQDHRPGAMVEVARRVTEAAAAAEVPLLLFNFASIVSATAKGTLFDDFRRIADILAASEVPVARIETTSYMDNFVSPAFRGAIEGGTLPYPIPEGLRIFWVSHATLGEAMVAAADRGAGEWFIGGPEGLSGGETAAALAVATGRPVQFVPVPLPDFAAALDGAFGAPAGERIASIYGHVAEEPEAFVPRKADMEALGIVPETLADFLARRWQATAPAAVAAA